jgi:transcriptional regulator with XRE-family HTH domain
MTKETLGSRIKEERRHLNLSQGELGDMAGINRDTLSRIERDIQLPDAAEIAILAGLFGRSVDWLLGVKHDRLWASDTGDQGPQVSESQGVYINDLDSIEAALVAWEGAVTAMVDQGRNITQRERARLFRDIYRSVVAQGGPGSWTSETTPSTKQPTEPPPMPSEKIGGGAKS